MVSAVFSSIGECETARFTCKKRERWNSASEIWPSPSVSHSAMICSRSQIKQTTATMLVLRILITIVIVASRAHCHARMQDCVFKSTWAIRSAVSSEVCVSWSSFPSASAALDKSSAVIFPSPSEFSRFQSCRSLAARRRCRSYLPEKPLNSRSPPCRTYREWHCPRLGLKWIDSTLWPPRARTAESQPSCGTCAGPQLRIPR